MEPIKVEVSRPKIEFALDGQVLATFDFFELEDAFDAHKNDPEFAGVIGWMRSNGLPPEVDDRLAQMWIVRYVKRINEELKKESGPLS